MSSVREKVEETLEQANAVKIEIVQKQARLDQLLEQLKTDFDLDSVEAAREKAEKLDGELVEIEAEMEGIRSELEEALNA